MKYEPKDKIKHKRGQQAFFIEVGGLASLMAYRLPYFNKMGPAELVRLAIPGLIHPSKRGALRPGEVERKTSSKTERGESAGFSESIETVVDSGVAGSESDGGPALFVDTRTDEKVVRGYTADEHDILNPALGKIVWPEGDAQETPAIPAASDDELKKLIGEKLYGSMSANGPPIRIFAIDDDTAKNALPEDKQYLIDGLITHAGTWREFLPNGKRGDPRARNIFMLKSVFNYLMSLPEDSPELAFWREHEIAGHLTDREALIDASLSDADKAMAKKIWQASNPTAKRLVTQDVELSQDNLLPLMEFVPAGAPAELSGAIREMLASKSLTVKISGIRTLLNISPETRDSLAARYGKFLEKYLLSVLYSDTDKNAALDKLVEGILGPTPEDRSREDFEMVLIKDLIDITSDSHELFTWYPFDNAIRALAELGVADAGVKFVLQEKGMPRDNGNGYVAAAIHRLGLSDNILVNDLLRDIASGFEAAKSIRIPEEAVDEDGIVNVNKIPGNIRKAGIPIRRVESALYVLGELALLEKGGDGRAFLPHNPIKDIVRSGRTSLLWNAVEALGKTAGKGDEEAIGMIRKLLSGDTDSRESLICYMALLRLGALSEADMAAVRSSLKSENSFQRLNALKILMEAGQITEEEAVTAMEKELSERQFSRCELAELVLSRGWGAECAKRWIARWSEGSVYEQADAVRIAGHAGEDEYIPFVIASLSLPNETARFNASIAAIPLFAARLRAVMHSSENIAEGPARGDGHISQGEKAVREFEARIDEFRSRNITAEFNQRIVGLLGRLRQKPWLSSSEKTRLFAAYNKFKKGQVKIYDCDVIVKGEDDFFFDRFIYDDNELFIPVSFIHDLMARGPPGLADEFILHAIICPVLGHYPSIFLQQKEHPAHYNSGNYEESDGCKYLPGHKGDKTKPFKGLLGKNVREVIDSLLAGQKANARKRYADVLRDLNPDRSLRSEDAVKSLLADHNVTNPMRFPDLYVGLDAFKREHSEDDIIKIVVMGPGTAKLGNNREKEEYSPQLIEIMALLSGRKVECTVIDANSDVLDTACNPHRYRYYCESCDVGGNFKGTAIYRVMRESLSGIVKDARPEDFIMTDYFNSRTFEIDPERTKSFIIDPFCGLFENINYGNDEVDLIVGTVSVDYAVRALGEKGRQLDLLAKLGRAIKPSGKIFLDIHTLAPIYKTIHGEKGERILSRAQVRKILPVIERELSRRVGAKINIVVRGDIIEITKSYPAAEGPARDRPTALEVKIVQLPPELREPKGGMIRDEKALEAGRRQADEVVRKAIEGEEAPDPVAAQNDAAAGIEKFVADQVLPRDRDIVRQFLSDGEVIVTASDGSHFLFTIENIEKYDDGTQYYDIEVREITGEGQASHVGYMVFSYRRGQFVKLYAQCTTDPFYKGGDTIAINVNDDYKELHKGIGSAMVELARYHAAFKGASLITISDVSDSGYLDRIGFGGTGVFNLDQSPRPIIDAGVPPIEILAKQKPEDYPQNMEQTGTARVPVSGFAKFLRMLRSDFIPDARHIPQNMKQAAVATRSCRIPMNRFVSFLHILRSGVIPDAKYIKLWNLPRDRFEGRMLLDLAAFENLSRDILKEIDPAGRITVSTNDKISSFAEVELVEMPHDLLAAVFDCLERQDSDRLKRVGSSAGALLAKMHLSGVICDDSHAKNYVVSPGGDVYRIDLENAHVFSKDLYDRCRSRGVSEEGLGEAGIHRDPMPEKYAMNEIGAMFQITEMLRPEFAVPFLESYIAAIGESFPQAAAFARDLLVVEGPARDESAAAQTDEAAAVEKFVAEQVLPQDREIARRFLADGEVVVTASDGARFLFSIENIKRESGDGLIGTHYYNIDVQEMAGDRPVLRAGFMIFLFDGSMARCNMDPLMRTDEASAISVSEPYRSLYSGIGSTAAHLALYYTAFAGGSVFDVVNISESGYLERLGFDKHGKFRLDQSPRPFIDSNMPPIEILAKTKAATPDPAVAQMAYIDKSEPLFAELLGEGKPDVLLRVPVPGMEGMSKENIQDFLGEFQRKPNGYVELFDPEHEGDVDESVYREQFGIEKKALPKSLEKGNRTPQNTVTLLSAGKNEELKAMDVKSKVGDRGMTRADTIVSPMGSGDPAGLINASVFGLDMMKIARRMARIWQGMMTAPHEQGRPINLNELRLRNPREYRNLMDDTQVALEKYKIVSGPDVSFEFTEYEVEGVLGLTTGDINCIVRTINKILSFLPIRPIEGDAIRKIFERVAVVIRDA